VTLGSLLSVPLRHPAGEPSHQAQGDYQAQILEDADIAGKMNRKIQRPAVL
jgi:hypothetical protein